MGRYDRQITLAQVGFDGQARLRQARVLVVGAGGLGCPALQYLVAAGVGCIGIMDGDSVTISNLHRQPLFNAGDVGRKKAIIAAERLGAQNPEPGISALPYHLSPANALETIETLRKACVMHNADTGSFAVTTPVANPGDSGGALYVSSRLVGVTRSQSGYTSVPAHLDWIIEASRYAWPYGTPQRRVRLGTTLSTFPESSHRVCQYACEHTACAAYNWSPLTETCTLLATVTGAYDSPFVLSEDRAIRGLSR